MYRPGALSASFPVGGGFGVRTALGVIVFRRRLATCIRFGGMATGIKLDRSAGRLGGSSAIGLAAYYDPPDN